MKEQTAHVLEEGMMLERKSYERSGDLNRRGAEVQQRRADEVRKNFAVGITRVITAKGAARETRLKTDA